MAFTENRHDQFLSQIIRSKIACEAALLSTCNRTEIYCETPDPYRLMDWFADKHGIHTDVLAPYCYIHHDQEGLKHTLRVASGLDSMMLGEPQILGQMKQAYHQACRLGTIKSTLKPIFQHVFKASKRIRTLSGIGKNPLSVAYAAAQLIQQSFTQPEQLRVFLIGSGEIAATRNVASATGWNGACPKRRPSGQNLAPNSPTNSCGGKSWGTRVGTRGSRASGRGGARPVEP